MSENKQLSALQRALVDHATRAAMQGVSEREWLVNLLLIAQTTFRVTKKSVDEIDKESFERMFGEE